MSTESVMIRFYEEAITERDQLRNQIKQLESEIVRLTKAVRFCDDMALLWAREREREFDRAEALQLQVNELTKINNEWRTLRGRKP